MVCDAVQHGHLKGIVHRDLKPGNILVDSSGQPKVVDFGIARSTDSDMVVTTLQTDVGALIGTLQYMSPEQCEADPSDIDVRSDVYALGVILYELLTGKPPYDIKQVAIHEAVRIVREVEPTKLSTIDRHLRGDIETISRKALEKDRSRRYQSTTALQEDIGHYLNDEPISAKPPGAIDYLKRFARKHTAATISIGTVLVILIAAFEGVSIFATLAEQQRREAETMRELATQQANISAQEARDARELADSAGRFISRMFDSDGLTTLFFQIDINVIDRMLSHAADQARAEFTDANNIPQQQLLIAILEMIGSTYCSMAFSDVGIVPEDIAADMAERATFYYRKVFELYREILGDDDPHTLNAMANLGNLLAIHTQKFEGEAERLCLDALKGRRRVLGENHPDTLKSMISVAVMKMEEGKHAEAEPLLIEVLERGRSIVDDAKQVNEEANLALGRVPPNRERIIISPEYAIEPAQESNIIMALQSLSIIMFSQGRYDEAKVYFSELLDLVWDDADSLNSLVWRGISRYDGSGSVPVISDEFLRAAKRACELSGYENSMILDTLARVHLERGEIDEAIQFQKLAVDFSVGAVRKDMIKKLTSFLKIRHEAAETNESAPE
jgi:tetratricopeptide (TPR) repeat protein